MDQLKHYILSRKLILIFTILFFLVRLPFLDSTFLLYDERDMALTQYSLAKTGKDLYGNKTPVVFDRISPHAPILAMYYGIPFYLAGLEKSVATSRFIYLLPMSLLPILVFELLYALLKRKGLSIVASLIFSFSPWVFHISRLGLEINLAFPIFLGALLAQIKRKVPLPCILYGLAFFTYQGMRPLLLIMMLSIEVFHANRIFTKKTILNIGIFLLFFASLFIGSLYLEGNISRRSSSEIVFFNTERLAQEINHNRFISFSPPPFKALFDNKVVAVVTYLANNLFEGVNMSYLFKSSDYVPIYSNGVTGQFYPIFALLLLFGIMSLGKKPKRENLFIALFTLFGLVSSIVNIYSLSFSIRSLFSGVGFSFLMGLGLLEAESLLRRTPKIIYTICSGIFIITVCFQASSFYYRYTYQRPIWQSELFNESERTLSSYLTNKKIPFTVKTGNAFSNYLSYVFLQNLDASEISIVQTELNTNLNSFRLNKIHFLGCNGKEIDLIQKPQRLIVEETCLSIKSLSFIKEKNLLHDNIYFADFNPLDTSKRVKYYVFE